MSLLTQSSPIGRTLFANGELLPNQKETIARCINLLERFRLGEKKSNSVKEFPWYEESNQPTQVISLLGGRGTGKTACLLTLCKQLDINQPKHLEYSQGQLKPYCIVPVIVPEILNKEETLISVFITNLLRMVSLVAEQPNYSQYAVEIQSSTSKFIRNITAILESSVVSTVEGKDMMRSLSGDVETFVRRLAAHQTTHQRRAFLLHEAIVEFLDKIVHCDLLVVPLDDVDLARHRSEEMLELIKVYLSHARIAVLLTADLDTMRRSIRNRLLAELPVIFSGGASAKPPSDSEPESGFASLFGSNKATLVASEYLQDDKYAEAYLFKMLPPAYRCELRGLGPTERLGAKFAVSSDISLSIEEVLKNLPLLSEVIHEPDDFSGQQEQKLDPRFAELISSKRGQFSALADLCFDYPNLLSPNLRTVLNQLIFLQSLEKDYIDKCRAICAGTLDPAINESPVLGRKKPIGWTLSEMRSTEEFPAVSMRLMALETEIMMKIVRGLALNSEIDGQRHLFLSERFQANALDASTIDIFWGLLDSISCGGTGPLGAIFVHRFAGRTTEYFGDASNALLSFVCEYAVLRSGRLWWVLEEIGLDLHEMWGSNIAPLAFLNYCVSNDSEEQTSKDFLRRHLAKTIEVTEGIRGGERLNFSPRSSKLGPPLFLKSIKQASAFSQSVFHSRMHADFQKDIETVSDAFDKFYGLSDDASEKMHLPEVDAALIQEQNLALRILGILAQRMLYELRGHLQTFVSREQQDPPSGAKMGIGRTDLPWLIMSEKSSLWFMNSLLTIESPNSPRSLLCLLYTGSLPVVPLLFAWSGGADAPVTPHILLNTIHSILSSAQNRYCNDAMSQNDSDAIEVSINFEHRSTHSGKWGQWQKGSLDTDAVVIKGFSRNKVPTLFERYVVDAPVSNLQFQAESLNLFVEALLQLEAQGPQIDRDGCPSVWREVVENTVTNERVEVLLKQRARFGSKKKPGRTSGGKTSA